MAARLNEQRLRRELKRVADTRRRKDFQDFVIPNDYVLRIAPGDYIDLLAEEDVFALRNRLRTSLLRHASLKNERVVSPPLRVKVIAEQGQRPGSVYVTSSFRDPVVRECGPMAWPSRSSPLLILSGRSDIHYWEVTGSPVRIGRDRSNDIILNSVSVSREHFCLSRNASGRFYVWVVHAFPARNGTLLVRAGRKQELPVGLGWPLVGGDILSIGGVSITFLTGDSLSN